MLPILGMFMVLFGGVGGWGVPIRTVGYPWTICEERPDDRGDMRAHDLGTRHTLLRAARRWGRKSS